MAGGVLAVVIGAGFHWMSGGRWIDTDDAYVQADSMILSTDVSGIVASIPVHEGEAVTKGQILFRLDPLKFQIALDNARANLAQVRLNVGAMKADYQAALQNTSAKEQQVNADQATYDRYASLVERHAVTQQEADDARYKLAADQQAVNASESQGQAQLAKLDGKPNIAVEGRWYTWRWRAMVGWRCNSFVPGRPMPHMWTAPSSQGVLQCFDQIACVHMSGLLVRSHMNAGQDGFRDGSSKHKRDLVEGHCGYRSVSRRGSIDHTICSLSCKFWHRLSTVAVQLLPVSG